MPDGLAAGRGGEVTVAALLSAVPHWPVMRTQYRLLKSTAPVTKVAESVPTVFVVLPLLPSYHW